MQIDEGSAPWWPMCLAATMVSSPEGLSAVDPADCPALAKALGVTADVTVAASRLAQERARAFVKGAVGGPEVALVETEDAPEEVFIVGKDPYLMLECVEALHCDHWCHLNVPRGLERKLTSLVRQRTQWRPSTVCDIVQV